MAAAVVPASAIDLKAPNTFSLRLGASIAQDGDAKRYRNVRYNHKPAMSRGATVDSTLLPGKQAKASTLSLKEGDKEWTYTGRRREDEDMYVLVVGGEGNKEVVLERLGDSYAVNLTRTPEDHDLDSVARKYPHMADDASEIEEEGLFGEDDAGDAAPDANNPFDFRHFLKSVEAVAPSETPSSQPNRSTAGTPQHRPPTSTPTSLPTKPTAAAPVTKKRRTPSAAATRPNPKRIKAGEDAPAANTSKKPTASKPTTSVPEVRIDRKASLRQPPTSSSTQKRQPAQPDYEDDGELILENSTPEGTKQNSTHLSAMSLALSGALSNRGAGPISLRSAASSPASRINSPHANSAAKPEGEEFEFGGGSSPEPEQQEQEQEQYEFEFEHDEDEDGQDGDVEDLEQPSPEQPEQQQPPRQPPAPSRSRRASLAVPAGDDEDDMEAQLALAMAAEEEDEEPAPAGRVDESDEDVSEEE